MPDARRFVLIDRDGTLNVEKHYLSDPDDFVLIPGAGAAIRRLKDAGFGVAVITNQSGIARGYFDLARLDRIHARMTELLAAEGAAVDGVYLCPHGPDDDCACRKPLPGMVEQAVAEHGFDPARSVMIGDKEVDVELGLAVGAETFLVRTGHGAKHVAGTKAHHVVDDLPAAVEMILAATT
ncbi:D-glycero-beta-D-manno-heptose 1,7-bisphosphate 7-phosphatase [Magnetospirillum sp. UT-4]|uniref:D-glycero-beta-D-manno-heptose 1,7-bisphosphate 7-phosphatase n=1 Tax=Magnetospirillum sp. UT-4 TaxID=2681467 RepID=UPI001382A110|nr:D-glycero-beta-D-manno-heptose 1,7-bisphosphate 7-phosphatase [Magnetospirillum sp. UT-4]CAA7612162.1 D-glycero-beta-D-manno-heptose-1,7-bisphosphate 7-phosphatase [Magnetospirillum sp. UT-4]